MAGRRRLAGWARPSGMCWNAFTSRVRRFSACRSTVAKVDSIDGLCLYVTAALRAEFCCRQEQSKNEDGVSYIECYESGLQQQRQWVFCDGASANNIRQSWLFGAAAQGPQTDAGLLQRLHTPWQNTWRWWVILHNGLISNNRLGEETCRGIPKSCYPSTQYSKLKLSYLDNNLLTIILW